MAQQRGLMQIRPQLAPPQQQQHQQPMVQYVQIPTGQSQVMNQQMPVFDPSSFLYQ